MSGESIEDIERHVVYLEPLERHLILRAVRDLIESGARTTFLEDQAIGTLADKVDPGWRDRPPRPRPE